jgi:hypothetical protein
LLLVLSTSPSSVPLLPHPHTTVVSTLVIVKKKKTKKPIVLVKRELVVKRWERTSSCVHSLHLSVRSKPRDFQSRSRSMRVDRRSGLSGRERPPSLTETITMG